MAPDMSCFGPRDGLRDASGPNPTDPADHNDRTAGGCTCHGDDPTYIRTGLGTYIANCGGFAYMYSTSHRKHGRQRAERPWHNLQHHWIIE
jgi:hypothetical protein